MGGNRKELLPANSSRACSGLDVEGFRFRVRHGRILGCEVSKCPKKKSYFLPCTGCRLQNSA